MNLTSISSSKHKANGLENLHFCWEQQQQLSFNHRGRMHDKKMASAADHDCELQPKPKFFVTAEAFLQNHFRFLWFMPLLGVRNLCPYQMKTVIVSHPLWSWSSFINGFVQSPIFALMGHNNAAASAIVLTKNKLIMVITSLCTIRSSGWAEPKIQQ